MFQQGCQKSSILGHKNEDISKTNRSMDPGVIFRPGSGQDLSRNVPVVSVYALYKNLYVGIGFCMTPKVEIFRKSALSKRFAEFGRPCRGFSTWKGASPQGRIPYDS